MKEYEVKGNVLIIDALNSQTYPEEANDIVLSHIALLPDEKLRKIRDIHIEYESDVRCAFDGFLNINSTHGYKMFTEELIPVFNKYNILCYHATRVENINTIKERGLLSSLDDYDQLLSGFLKREGINKGKIEEILESIHCVARRKNYKGIHQICFYINKNDLYNEDGSAGYDQFLETIGGELAHWALYNKNPETLSILQTKGIPVVVCFKTPFSRIAYSHKDKVISPFVYNIAAKSIWDFDYEIRADAELVGDVTPENIVEIIPYK